MKLPKVLRPKRSSSTAAGFDDSISSPSSSSAAPSPSPRTFLSPRWNAPIASSSTAADTAAAAASSVAKLFSPRKSPSPRWNAPIASSSRAAAAAASSSSSPSGMPIRAELEAVFRFFDANNDGKISVMEIAAVLKCLGDPPTEEDLYNIITEVDSDGDGFISLDEFLHFHAHEPIDAAELQAVFSVFDLDRNGFISADELHLVLVALGEAAVTMEDCGRMIRGVDRDGDGRVDFEEFKIMMSATA